MCTTACSKSVTRWDNFKDSSGWRHIRRWGNINVLNTLRLLFFFLVIYIYSIQRYFEVCCHYIYFQFFVILTCKCRLNKINYIYILNRSGLQMQIGDILSTRIFSQLLDACGCKEDWVFSKRHRWDDLGTNNFYFVTSVQSWTYLPL